MVILKAKFSFIRIVKFKRKKFLFGPDFEPRSPALLVLIKYFSCIILVDANPMVTLFKA